jgi:hypothetical protein
MKHAPRKPTKKVKLMNPTITVVNQSQQPWLKATTLADLQAQASEAAAAWGYGSVTLQISNDDPRSGWRIYIRDTSDGTQGALGYHSTKMFTPVGFVFTDQCAANQASISSVLSHELLEMIGDPNAKSYLPMVGGGFMARELCDPVQADLYIQGETEVSNWVYPRYFDPKASAVDGALDKMGKCLRPFEVRSNGGYAIVDKGDGKGQQYVWGAIGLHIKNRCALRIGVKVLRGNVIR